jgi:hypothetical protein
VLFGKSAFGVDRDHLKKGRSVIGRMKAPENGHL